MTDKSTAGEATLHPGTADRHTRTNLTDLESVLSRPDDHSTSPVSRLQFHRVALPLMSIQTESQIPDPVNTRLRIAALAHHHHEMRILATDHLLAGLIRQSLALPLGNQYPIAVVHLYQEIEKSMETDPRQRDGLMHNWQNPNHLIIATEIPVHHQVVQRTEAHIIATQYPRVLQRRQFRCRPTTVPAVPLFFLHLLAPAVVHPLLTAALETTLTVVHLRNVAAVHPRRHRTMGPHLVSTTIRDHRHHQIMVLVPRTMAPLPLTKLHTAPHPLSAPTTVAQQLIHAHSASIILLPRRLSRKAVRIYQA